MSPVEGYVPPDPNVYVPMEPISEADFIGSRPEAEQFQAGEFGIPPHFFSRAQVGGHIRRKSSLLLKKGIDGVNVHVLYITMDVGPVYSRTKDPRKKRIRNIITCVFFDYHARKLDKAIRDLRDQVFSQPWMMITGKIENRFDWIDKENLSLGKAPTGEMRIIGEEWFIPPIPKLSQIRPKFREEGFPDAHGVIV